MTRDGFFFHQESIRNNVHGVPEAMHKEFLDLENDLPAEDVY